MPRVWSLGLRDFSIGKGVGRWLREPTWKENSIDSMQLCRGHIFWWYFGSVTVCRVMWSMGNVQCYRNHGHSRHKACFGKHISAKCLGA